MKDEKFRGVNAPIPVYYTRPQGRSATFATAQSAASASKIGEFLLTRKANYGVATIVVRPWQLVRVIGIVSLKVRAII